MADNYCDIPETNETNNTAQQPFQVIQADLTVTDLSVSPAIPLVGQPVTFTMVVKNVGTYTSQSAWSGVYIDKETFTSADCGTPGDQVEQVPGLSPGQSYTMTLVYWSPTLPKTYTALGRADYHCVIDEITRDNNNSDLLSFQAQWAGPDLVVDSITADPVAPRVSDPVTLTLRVRNAGNIASPSGGQVGLYLNGNTYAGGCPGPTPDYAPNIPALAVGESRDLVIPTSGFTAEGANLVEAVADWRCDIEELNDLNNYLHTTVNVNPALLPELAIASITANPASPPAGDPITYTVRVSNTGAAASPAGVKLGLYIGLENEPDPYQCNQTPGQSEDLPLLAAGSSADVEFVTDGFPIMGAYTVFVMADYDCQVPEENDFNNTGNLTLQVGDERRPDLAVTGLASDPAEPFVGDWITVTVTVTNQGTKEAPVTWLALYKDWPPGLCDATHIANTAQTPALAAGATVTLTVALEPFTSQGNPRIYAYADYNCTVAEPDEANNVRDTSLVVLPAPLPDLQVESITPQGAALYSGEWVTYTVRVRNVGGAALANNAALLGWYQQETDPALCTTPGSGPEPVTNRQIPFIAAGDFVDVQVIARAPDLSPSAPPSGETQMVYAYADYSCLVAEENETNNMRGQPVDFLPPRRPDLTIASVTTLPAMIRAEEYFSATVHVVNQGNRDSGVSGVTVYTDEGVSGPPSCGNAGGWANANIFASLAPGQGVDVTLPQIRYMTPGEHLLWAFVDHTCALIETLESNNVFTQTLQVDPPKRPDLVITSFTAEPSEPAAQELVTYTLVIENQGDMNNTSITWAGIYLDREPSCGDIGDRVAAVSPLAIGESATVTLKAPFETAGSHQAWAMANYGCPSTGGGAESDYSNNTAGPLDFQVDPPLLPDLTITGITTLPEAIRAEEYFSATVHVVNQGTRASSVSGVTIYTDEGVSGPPSCGNTGGWANANTFASLAPGQGVDVALPQIRYMTPGEHLLWAFVDHTCTTTETLESNNVFTQTLQVARQHRPDLVITSFTAEPSEPAARDLITYTLVIMNQGDVDYTTVSWAGIYLDREPSCGDIGDRVVDVGPLAIGESATVTLKAPFETAGSHQAWAMANYRCWSGSESDFSNNTAGPLNFQVDPPLLPDIEITGIVPMPAAPAAGQWITYKVHVRNNGNTTNTSSVGSWGLGLYQDHEPDLCNDGAWTNTATIPALAPGAEAEVEVFTYGFSQMGDHQVYAVADFICLHEESNEANNRFGPLSITAGPPILPDLVVQSVTIIPEQPAANQLAQFVITARNQGTGDVQYPVFAKVYRDNVPSECGANDIGVGDPTYRFEPLAAGASTTFTMTAAFNTQGTHTAYVVLDFNCLQPESSETNNTRGPITVEVGPPGRPDLAIVDMHVVEAAPVVGQTTHIAVTVRNQGLDRTPSTSTWKRK